MKTLISKLWQGNILLISFTVLIAFTMVSCQSTTSDMESVESVSQIADRQMRAKKGAGSQKPDRLKPNSQKYNDSSMPSASGRDGEVTVTARAMINHDGQVTLEVTTGELDSGEKAPGTITKLLVKALDSENPDPDSPVWEKNYNKLRDGGYFITTYDNLEKGQPLYVHANVRGIIRGTAVVKLTETVKARPDLAVTEIEAPEEVFVDNVVNVHAQISELQGNLGARATCVMDVDGVEIDRAEGIWVDAGDAVECAFMTQFSTTGTKHVTVSVIDVVPGDFRYSNNSAYTEIQVVEEDNNTYYYDWSGSFYVKTTKYEYFNQDRTQEDTVQFLSTRGFIWLPFTFPMNAEVTVSSGGYEWENTSLNLVRNFLSCSVDILPNDVTLQVCADNGALAGVFLRTVKVQIVYYGYDYSGDYYYDVYGKKPYPYGDDLAFEVSLDDGINSAIMQAEFDLDSIETGSEQNDYYIKNYKILSGSGSGSSQ